jgi:hypothetical protein
MGRTRKSTVEVVTGHPGESREAPLAGSERNIGPKDGYETTARFPA